ncbi:MAG: DUF445 domain-containing protein [Cycloclasticus sp.]|jgi:uncharacterized membrane protein YheB (UPF0754 family)|nr:DUF445 domain-containing protein [Cycloclasticus sp.]MEE4292181.1 DUF445 domain-containing protein [Cycloclasticus sp.]
MNAEKRSSPVNKSLITNLIAIGIIIASFFTPLYTENIKAVGVFALSGAVTNWIAIHMLFEKVPFLYGSGVIPAHFEEFKRGIQELIMRQFFTQENIERFLQREEDSAQQLFNVDPLLDRLDYDQLFQGLVDAIAESSFGSMLAMVGGVAALDPLKKPVCKKIRLTLTEMTQSEAFIEAIHEGINAQQISGDLINDIEAIVEKRLDELTPDMVKTIIQQMIKEHLGWLVVWGGVFGGLIGLGFSFI